MSSRGLRAESGLRRLHRADGMVARIARHNQPSLASAAMVPELAVRSGGIVAQIDVFEEPFGRVRRVRIGARCVGVAEKSEFSHVAGAAMRAGDSHDLN